MKTEARPKEPLEPPGTRRGRSDPPLAPPEELGPADASVLDFQPPGL